MSNTKRNIILYDDDKRSHLFPLSLTRPIADLRIGILTIAEKWEKYLNGNVSFISSEYLAQKFPLNLEDDNLLINSRLLANRKLINFIKNLRFNDALIYQDQLIVARLDSKQFERIITNDSTLELSSTDLSNEAGLVNMITRPYDLFKMNGAEIQADFDLITNGRSSAATGNLVQKNGNNLFVEEGVELNHCILNSSTGPIYLGKGAKILDGAIIRGPFALCEASVVKMGAKIYGPTTIGPHSKVGGEINNCVFQSYSNKGHDGFLGNSVIGEWCNLGADTNNSNLKNNYEEVKLWNYASRSFEKSGEQFCGLIMGDHSKCGINTMFNTGTVVGVSCNIYGSGFPRNFIPSFSWGGAAGYTEYRLDKACDTASKMMARRNVPFDEVEKSILAYIFDETKELR